MMNTVKTGKNLMSKHGNACYLVLVYTIVSVNYVLKHYSR